MTGSSCPTCWAWICRPPRCTLGHLGRSTEEDPASATHPWVLVWGYVGNHQLLTDADVVEWYHAGLIIRRGGSNPTSATKGRQLPRDNMYVGS